MRLIRDTKITLGGNQKLKIFGTLHCKSGKRMKPENRVFFASQSQAINAGYRPCGNCMKTAYQKWISSTMK
ncbi:Ada metal-binding domain-containing protein [Daejeonella lutea]|nr:Ada metal-binding domain-containing protein [Daejeonella lutea]